MFSNHPFSLWGRGGGVKIKLGKAVVFVPFIYPLHVNHKLRKPAGMYLLIFRKQLFAPLAVIPLNSFSFLDWSIISRTKATHRGDEVFNRRLFLIKEKWINTVQLLVLSLLSKRIISHYFR